MSLLSGRRFDPRFETLLVHGRLAAGEGSMADFAEREGARTEYVSSLGQPVSAWNDPLALARLIGIAHRFRPHIVHTHTAKAGFLGRAAGLTLRPRPLIIHTYHGHVLRGYFGPRRTALYRDLERLMGRVSDRLLGVSRATVDELVGMGVAPREKFREVPLGADLEPFANVTEEEGRSARRELDVSDDETLLLSVGRLVPIKRLDVLLHSVRHALGLGAAVRLAIVGDGELRPRLERLAGELEIRDAVEFLGFRRDLPRIAAAADVAVLSSDNEGTPVALIEAAAAGRPAAATAVGGVPEVVTEDVGIVVPPRDPIALGRAMTRLAESPELRAKMGEGARRSALRRYSAERLLADVLNLYDELLDRSAAA